MSALLREKAALSPALGVFLCQSASDRDFHGDSALVAAAEKGVMLMNSKTQSESGMEEVFCRFIRKAGKIIYPKNGNLFHFFVPLKA